MGWMRKTSRWSSVEMGRTMSAFERTLALDQVIPECLRNMSSSLAVKKLVVVGAVSSSSGAK